jgi:hypothetical protein
MEALVEPAKKRLIVFRIPATNDGNNGHEEPVLALLCCVSRSPPQLGEHAAQIEHDMETCTHTSTHASTNMQTRQ